MHDNYKIQIFILDNANDFIFAAYYTMITIWSVKIILNFGGPNWKTFERKNKTWKLFKVFENELKMFRIRMPSMFWQTSAVFMSGFSTQTCFVQWNNKKGLSQSGLTNQNGPFHLHAHAFKCVCMCVCVSVWVCVVRGFGRVNVV